MTEETEDIFTSSGFIRGLARRRKRERVLKWAGIVAIAIAIGMLLILFGSIAVQSTGAFQQARIELPIFFDPEIIGSSGYDEAAIRQADFRQIYLNGLYATLGRPSARKARRQLRRMMSPSVEYSLRQMVLDKPTLIGQKINVWLPASTDVDLIVKGSVPRDVPEDERMISDLQLGWVEELSQKGHLKTVFNWDFFLNNNSRNPEVAGIWAAVLGSVLMLLVTLVVTLPIAIAAAVYLEEFAPKNRWTELIDVNIRNLAAVPSILFGLLGLAVFIRLFGVPRSTPVAGGLVLGLLVLPTIIIAARAAIHAVPPSLREAALQLGASRMQTTFLTVLPNALPGILTGTIISMAEALGESAPLLMIGMVAFIASEPQGFTDPAAPLPVQIFLWSTNPERGYLEKTAAAIIALLVLLLIMNALAIWLRMRTQKKW